ncbi:uncharacterized protein RB166_007964 [Leptodactylus fuscus]
MSCALLVGLIWGLYHESWAQFCVDQPIRRESFVGESITIPCSFTYSEIGSSFSGSFTVKASSKHFCGRENEEIYSSYRNFTSLQYQGRLSVQYDWRARTSSLTVMNLRREDELNFCCRLTIHPSGKKSDSWQNPDGTSVVVKGEKEMILNQEFLILALHGDAVTIVVRFAFKNPKTTANVTECGVLRSLTGRQCGKLTYPVTCTQRNNENIVFMKLTNNADVAYGDFYCYSLNVTVNGTTYTRRTITASQLLVFKLSDAPKINQTTEVDLQGPVRINCSFSIQDMIHPYSAGSVLWTQVYWMVGEPRQYYVYHPNQDYIHPEYIGKATLVGQSDLLLQDIHVPDNTTLYCRVAIRLCSKDNKPPPNTMRTILEEGPGTILRVRAEVEQKPETPSSHLQTIIIGSCVGCAVLLLLVLSIMCLKANKAYENIGDLQRQIKEKVINDEKMVYATVLHSTAAKAKKPQLSEESEVVYAAVKKQ